MVGYFLVVEMPHARDKGRMAVLSGPVDRFFLRFECRARGLRDPLPHRELFSEIGGRVHRVPQRTKQRRELQPKRPAGSIQTLFRSEHGS